MSSEQREALTALRHDPSLLPAERDRVEMLFLSADAGWSVPRIAQHLGYHPATVREIIRRFPIEGVTVVRYQRKGPAPDVARRQTVETALRVRLAEERTWTARQLADALGEEGIRLSTRQTRRYLGHLGAWYRRTVRSLTHKQDPERVAVAREELRVLKNRPKQVS
jgi:transposase